jgi:hypothetical protein
VVLDDSTSDSAKVFDLSPHNPNIAHVLLGSVALIVLPTAVIGASFDWCSTGQSYWPTISMTTNCQPGGYFVAIVAVPACSAMGAIFWLINATATRKTSSPLFFKALSWEFQKTREWHTNQKPTCDPQQLAAVGRFGCLLGNAGAFLVLIGALIMKGSPFQSVMSLCVSIMSLGFIMAAMVLSVLTSDQSTQSSFRRRFTVLLCLPVMVFYTMLILARQSVPSDRQIPHGIFAMTEYAVTLLVSVWPLTWVTDVRDTWQLNASTAFEWPKTSFRFA